MESKKEDVATAIRSCLLTFKNGASLTELQKDYRSLEGKNIPYQRLGFPSLEACVESIAGVRTSRRGSELWVEIVPSEDTAHISRLVAGQNKSKSRLRRRPFMLSRRPQPMSRNNVRAASSVYGRAPNAANFDSRNNIPSGTQGKQPHSMELPLQTQPVNHRYAGTAVAREPSPPKRTTERSIQPRQDLDYATRPTTFAEPPLMANIPRAPIIPEVPQAPEITKLQRSTEIVDRSMPEPSETTKAARTVAEVPVSWISSTTDEPQVFQSLGSSSTGLAWRPPQASTLRLADRLIVAQQPSSCILDSSIAHTDIQMTFQNPQVSSAIDAQTVTTGPLSRDPRDELKRIARKLGHADPVYKTISAHNKSDPNVYGIVKIGAARFTSYPQDFQDPDAAMMLAIEKALVELRKELDLNRRLARTFDKNLMKKRLLEMTDRPAGIFVDKIPALYRQRYNEILPDDWTDEIIHWSELGLEAGADDSRILSRTGTSAPRNEIFPNDPTGEMIHSREFKLEEGTDDSQLLPRVDPTVTKKQLLKPIRHIEPGHLELPNEKFWVAKVRLVVSTMEIWVDLVGENYSEKLVSMTSEMRQFYSKMARNSEKIEQGGYYALLDDDTWHRVRVIEHDSTSDEAEIFFIDLGDEDTIKASRLYPLSQKFCSLPSQAIRISLHGLDDFADCESILGTIENYLLNSSHDGVFYVEELHREVDSYGPLANVIFYDTSGPDDVVVNDFIMRKILRDFTPRLEGQVSPVHVSHIEANGDVYVQSNHDGSRILSKILNKLVETGLLSEDRERLAPMRIDDTTLYLVRCDESGGDWHRGRFMNVATDGKNDSRLVKMFLIDSGRTIIVEPSSAIRLEMLSVLLSEYPAQAIKVRLDKIEVGSFGVEKMMRMKELAPPCRLLLLKVVRDDSTSPIVELFMKMPPGNILGSINNTLVLEPESAKWRIDGDGNNNNVKPMRKRFERINSRTPTAEHEVTAKALSAPKIAEIGKYFDVHVTMAANPDNFTVQPYETREELRIMMTKLQDACTSSSEGSPNIESIREGALFAVQHTDGDWYRGCVMNVLNKEYLTVYLVDYGDVTMMDPKKLLPLPRQFFELPYQAIKARLTGIKSSKTEWSPEDVMRFQNLIVDKNLVSIVTEIDADRHLPGDTVLGLNLVDVSTDNDIYIAVLLIKEGRAVFKD